MKKVLSLLTLIALISGVPTYGMFRGLTKAVVYSRMRPMTMHSIRPMSTTAQTPHHIKRLLTNSWVTLGSLFGLGSASAYAIRTLNNEIDVLESVNHALTEKVKLQDELGMPTMPYSVCKQDIVLARAASKWFRQLGNTKIADEFAQVEQNAFKTCTQGNKHFEFFLDPSCSPKELYKRNIQSGKELENKFLGYARYGGDGNKVAQFVIAAECCKQATQELQQEMPHE